MSKEKVVLYAEDPKREYNTKREPFRYFEDEAEREMGQSRFFNGVDDRGLDWDDESFDERMDREWNESMAVYYGDGKWA